MTKLAALIAGPLLVIAAGFLFFGEWGFLIAFFVGIGALVFIPLFWAGTAVFGSSLLACLLIALAIPVGHTALMCAGDVCPGVTDYTRVPLYVAALFTGFLYWAVTRLTRSD